VTAAEQAAATIRSFLATQEITYDEPSPGTFAFALPGTNKLETPVRLQVGVHGLAIQAFVCRQPDENHEGVYRWLLEKNQRGFAVAFTLDALGDIYLGGRLPLSAVTEADLDTILGAVLTTADESFNVILELGFATSIRKEWDWRRSRGESTANLAAFRGWLEAGDTDSAQ
jgi:hypothetical protein